MKDIKKQPQSPNSIFSRRTFLKVSSSSTVGLLLRSLATGLPPAWFLRSKPAEAQLMTPPPQTLIMSTSAAGDPVNVNCPGSYVDGIHNNPILSSQTVNLGSVRTRAATPWAELPESLRSRLAFFHFSSRSSAHPEYAQVMTFHGSVKNQDGNGTEMFSSAIAQMSHESIGTLQAEPLPLCSETLTFRGQPLQRIRPSEIKALFANAQNDISDLRSIRDQSLDQLYRHLRTDGTKMQRSFVDRYLQSRDQSRLLGEQLGTLLERLPTGNGGRDQHGDQILAAVALAKLKIAPVVTVRIPFGRDNHGDSDLSTEAEQTTVGTATIGQLWQELNDAGIQDQVSFAMLNVFGRTPQPNSRGGRNHNRHHNVLVAFGANINPGVYGGVDSNGRCLAIDPSSGQGTANGQIPVEETMETAGKSLAKALGQENADIDKRIHSGRIVDAFSA